MVKETPKVPVKHEESGERESLEKIRWSLRQRLCEQLRLLNTDLFDELDDFLFDTVQPEELSEGSTQLKLIREFRNKKQLFEEQFLASIDEALQSTLVPRDGEKFTGADKEQEQTSSSAYEAMEIDLALERMQRKAFKTYAGRIKELAKSANSEPNTPSGQVIPEKRDILINNSLRALAYSHEVFRVPLESRLVFFKLFEKHFLLNMDQLYQDVISIVNNKDNQKFVERLYSSSTSIYMRRGKGKTLQPAVVSTEEQGLEVPTGSSQIAATVDQLIESWCAQQQLPEFVESMLRNDWHGVMFLMGLNKGVETREWTEARQTIETMLSLLMNQPGQDGQNKDLGWLRSRLQQGFDLVQKSAIEQQEFSRQLEEAITGNGRMTAENTSLLPDSKTLNSDRSETGHQQSGHFAAVSEAGRKILDNNDLDDFVALLSDDQEQAIAELDEEAISMDYYLNMVDTMADGAPAEFKNAESIGKCRINKSASLEDSYQVLDEQGRVVLTRGRVGLAVSLRAGEIRLDGQQDFAQEPSDNYQIHLSSQTDHTAQPTTH